MLFSSLIFLYAFLPAVLLLYYLAPRKARNFILLLASLFFYGWGEPRYLILILVSIAFAYGAGLLLDRFAGQKAAKYILIGALVFHLGALGVFKYADLLISTVNGIFGASVPLWRLALPIGVSFYTFQILSYLVDLYRGRVQVQKNPLSFGMYVVLFPQLIAGPIVRYQDIEVELRNRKITTDLAYSGARRFLFGLGKKVLLANNLAMVPAAYRASADPTVLMAWLSAAAYMLQIYYDFSGYSDMAIGLGRLLGFNFPENFDYPYTSTSLTEFWRRWHMTLGSWFRDYVYIPLGGNRVSKWKWIRNICVVWGLTGLWHGAGWNFLLWGLSFAVLLLAEKMWYGNALKKHPAVGHIYVLLAVLLTFVLFGGNSFSEITEDLCRMFGFGGLSLWNRESFYLLRSDALLFLFSCIGATSLPASLCRKHEAKLNWIEPIFLAVLLLLSTAFLVDGSFNPFLYFRF